MELRQALTMCLSLRSGEGQPAEGGAGGATPAAGAGADGAGGGEEPMDEDALLQQALAMVLLSPPVALPRSLLHACKW